MSEIVIACDLGTGGVKSVAMRPNGHILAERIASYDTFYPEPGFHEQRPLDWWQGVVESIRALGEASGVDPLAVRAIAVSGHSLGCVPLGADGTLLIESTPIWSDMRATREADSFFAGYDYERWYGTTGNGFPAPLYTAFKLLWLKRQRPGLMEAARHVVGTKDYINFHLTGRIATDRSYASGTGIFDLSGDDYSAELLEAFGLDRSLFAEPLPSTATIGQLLPNVAASLGLPQDVVVVAGGVDNSCMALGARTFREGDLFCAMGSSSWLTVAAARPVLDSRVRPYSFAHVVPEMYISATSIFASGTSLDWMRDTILPDLADQARKAGLDVHEQIDRLAAEARFGSDGLLFVPTLGGGTELEGGPSVRGAFVGLDLKHGRAEILRATFEGIALALRVALDELRQLTRIGNEMVLVGGGARSRLWRQILADILGARMVKTSIDQQAAAIGAAALAFVGTGLWRDFAPVVDLHRIESIAEPNVGRAGRVNDLVAAYRLAAGQQRDLARHLAPLRSQIG